MAFVLSEFVPDLTFGFLGKTFPRYFQFYFLFKF